VHYIKTKRTRKEKIGVSWRRTEVGWVFCIGEYKLAGFFGNGGWVVGFSEREWRLDGLLKEEFGA
jgi:hypothetical protein